MYLGTLAKVQIEERGRSHTAASRLERHLFFDTPLTRREPVKLGVYVNCNASALWAPSPDDTIAEPVTINEELINELDTYLPSPGSVLFLV